MIEYKRFEGESDDELIYRICSNKDIIGTWSDVADILNDLLDTNFGESTFRKKYTVFTKMLEANKSRFDSADAHINEIDEKIRELRKERTKLQTEKVEYNRWLRENARDELILEKIQDSIAALPPVEIPDYDDTADADPKREYVLAFGDEHYGAEFEIKGLKGEILNAYSPRIFEYRMYRLMHHTKKIIEREHIKVLHIYSMGDFSDGCLRVSQLKRLRCGVVDGTIQYANFITEWLNKMTQYCEVKYHMTDGNHTELRELGQPKGTFVEDNMGKVVREFIKVRLQDNPRFEFVENPTGLIFDQLCGYTILGTHGEEKNMEQAIREFSQMYDVRINYLISGHYHHSRSEDVGFNTETINVPSIIGADPYSVDLRKVSNPAAKLFVLEESYGKVCEYTINLSV